MGFEKYIKKIGSKSHGHVIRGVFLPSEVLPFKTMGPSVKLYPCHGKFVGVNMDSQRYWVFSKSLRCPECGLEGEVMFLNSINMDDPKAHFNLYGMRNGELVMFTKDHILPKSKGGLNHLDNYVTMCCQCNWDRGNKKHKGTFLLEEIWGWQIDL